MRAWEKRACRSLFLVMLITIVLSPRAASFPDAPTSFHSCFYATCRALEHPTVSDRCLPRQQLSAPARTNGWDTTNSSQPVPLERHLSAFESKTSWIKETTKHRISSLNGPSIIVVFTSDVFFSVSFSHDCENGTREIRRLYFLTNLANINQALLIRWKEGARSEVHSRQ